MIFILPNSHSTHCSSCWNQGYQFYIKSPYIKHQTSVNTQIYFYSFAFRRILFFSWRLSPPLPLTDFACLRGLLPSSSYQSYLKLTAYALNLYGLLLEPSPPDSIPSSELRERTGTAPNALYASQQQLSTQPPEYTLHALLELPE